MTTRNLSHLCALLILSIPLAATSADVKGAKNSAPNLTAAQVVARNVQARGGLARWRAVHTMEMSGRLDAGKIRPAETEKAYLDRRMAQIGERKALLKQEKEETEAEQVVQLPFVMEMQRPRKMRLEIIFRGQTALQVYDGVNGWKLRPFLGRNDVEPYTQDETKTASQQQDIDGPLIDYVAKGTKVKLDGMEPVEGHNAYKLRLTLKNGDVRYVWVDAKTFLDVKIDGSRRLNGKIHQVATYLRNYKTTGGLKIPFLLETSVEGINGSEKIIIEKVVLNPKLDKALFTKPVLG